MVTPAVQGIGVRRTPNGSALGVHLCEAEAPTEPTGETMSEGQRVPAAVGETLLLYRFPSIKAHQTHLCRCEEKSIS